MIRDKYVFVSKDGDNWANICIREGKFRNVIYNYGKVSVNSEEENGDGTLPFRFEYNIIDNATLETALNDYNEFDHIIDNATLEREDFGEEFFTLIGDILVDIIDDQLKENRLEYNPDD